MRKYLAITDALKRSLTFRGRTVIDVGCGGGETVRWLSGQGASVVGLDNASMLARARQAPPWGSETYCEGVAQELPFNIASADAILYQASFHHVPAATMGAAAEECLRVLKSGGQAVFVEPVYQTGSYTDVTRLVEDEEEIQKKAHAAIVALAATGMTMEKNEFFYLERSFLDYLRLLEFFVADPAQRDSILAQAREVTETYGAASHVAFADFRYRSVCRLNILRKNGSRTDATWSK